MRFFRSRLARVFLLLLAAVALSACNQKSKPFSPPGNEFIIDLPGTPRAETKSVPGLGTITVYTVDKGGWSYGITRFDLPKAPPDIERALDAGRDGAAKNSRSKVLSERRLKVGGRPAREFVLVGETSEDHRRMRLILDDRVLYTIGISTPPKDASSAKVDMFLDSFRFPQ